MPYVGGEAVNCCLDFCTRARDYPAVGLRNHVRNGDRRIDLVDAADLLLEDEEVGKELRVCDIPRMDQKDVGVLHVAGAVGVKNNPLGRVLVHVLVRNCIGRNCRHEHHCHDNEADHRCEDCSWKPVHEAGNNCKRIDPTHAPCCLLANSKFVEYLHYFFYFDRGGPEPGVGYAGRGVLTALQVLKDLNAF